ncbi:hemolysin III family protein [Amnibacterium sp. CER49]|uniref:PAQR family membrane homeostasis protein TrhA n=1 Tax=Amnibacterium sp. CER49 TaxID=3039161 RepID=UPI003263AD7D
MAGTDEELHRGGPVAARPLGESPRTDLPHLPLVEESGNAAHAEPRPTWRGWLHLGTTPVALVLGIVLVALADGAEAKIASAVFAVTSLLLFGNSALYHRVDWSPKVKRALKRVDHANIFLLIAGTYTPMSLLALPGAPGVVLLAVVWGVALVGIGFRVFWIGAPRWLYVPIYIGLGWAAVMDFGPLFANAAPMMVLFLVGGVLYTLGAVAYAVKRPNPFPGRFGFHEVFHACTVLAFACHWAATLLIALHPVR